MSRPLNQVETHFWLKGWPIETLGKAAKIW